MLDALNYDNLRYSLILMNILAQVRCVKICVCISSTTFHNKTHRLAKL